MPDTSRNRRRLIRFIAQEVLRDQDTVRQIPHFDKSAVAIILREAQRRAGRRGKLSLRLRELGGLVRIAGDLAVEAMCPSPRLSMYSAPATLPSHWNNKSPTA